MALDLIKITTQAECDALTKVIDIKLDRYQHRDQSLDFGDRQHQRATESREERLNDAEAEIISANAILAAPNVTDKRRTEAENDLRSATFKRDTLLARMQAEDDVDAVLEDLEIEQIDAQVAILTAARAQILAHRATLSA